MAPFPLPRHLVGLTADYLSDEPASVASLYFTSHAGVTAEMLARIVAGSQARRGCVIDLCARVLKGELDSIARGVHYAKKRMKLRPAEIVGVAALMTGRPDLARGRVGLF